MNRQQEYESRMYNYFEGIMTMNDSVFFDYPFAGTTLTVHADYERARGPLGETEYEIGDMEITFPDGTFFEAEGLFVERDKKVVPIYQDIEAEAYGRI